MTTAQLTDWSSEPQAQVTCGQTRITLLGTAHVSRTSADAVRALIASGDFDAVAIELCPSRLKNLEQPDHMSEQDVIHVLRNGQATMVIASLALGAFQQRMAEQFDIQPGAEMRAALEGCEQRQLPNLLIDRNVGTTLRRCYHHVPFWQRFSIVAGLFGSVVSRQDISEEQIEKLKEGDVLEAVFDEFALQNRAIYDPLIDERDRFMAAKLREAAESGSYKHILAVVGAGHLKGIRTYLEGEATETPAETVARLQEMPPKARWPKVIPWLIVALVLGGFALGFSRSPELGWQLIRDWVLINGVFASIGAALAMAHPLTIITAFLAAPLTSLNPGIGVGMVTGPVEAWLRKPRVGDFALLRHDTSHWRGWWRNRVSRVFLVFLFSTIGSAIATYTAGYLIAQRLVS